MGARGAVGASLAFNYLGGDPSHPGSANHNLVRAAIENVAGHLAAARIDVSSTYDGIINNLTVAGSVAVGTGVAAVGLGGAVSINIIHDTSDAHISGSPNVKTTAAGADSLDVSAADTSTIRALAGGVGIAVSLGTLGLAAGLSVAVNEIGSTTEAYVDGSNLNSAGDVNVEATSQPTIEALSIGVAVAVAVSGEEGAGFAGSGAGAGSGNTVQDTVLAYINNSTVSPSINNGTTPPTYGATGAVNVSATDSALIGTIAGALAVGVAVGTELAAAGSIGISVAVNDIQDNIQAYIDNSTVTANGHDVSLAATEGATIVAWTIGGAVSVGASPEGALGIGVGAAAPAPATPSATPSWPISGAIARLQP